MTKPSVVSLRVGKRPQVGFKLGPTYKCYPFWAFNLVFLWCSVIVHVVTYQYLNYWGDLGSSVLPKDTLAPKSGVKL